MARGLQIAYKTFDIRDGNNPTVSADIESFHSQRVYDVDWLSYGVAIYQLLGYPTMDNSDPSHPKIVRYLPQQDPDFPWAVATKIISVKGVGPRGYYNANDSRAALYDKARITVGFDFPDYDILADEYTPDWPFEFYRYRTFEAKPSAEYLSPPSTGTLKWSQGPNAGSPFPGNVGFIVGCIDYVWDWIQVPFEAMPGTAIQDTVGCVNKYDFEIGDGSTTVAPAGTLLLMGWEPLRKNSPYGLRTWRIRYTARFNPYGHNNFYDYDGAHFNDSCSGGSSGSYNPGWRQASRCGTYFAPGSVPDGQLLYNERDFDLLFTPPAV